MRVLVTDWNLSYARKVARLLKDLVPNLAVDTATNSFEVERRLETHKYDLILVDYDVSMDPDHMKAVLNTTNTPKISWREQGRLDADERSGPFKPLLLEDLTNTLTKEVLPALHTHV